MNDPIGACPLLETSIDSGFSQAEGLLNDIVVIKRHIWLKKAF